MVTASIITLQVKDCWDFAPMLLNLPPPATHLLTNRHQPCARWQTAFGRLCFWVGDDGLFWRIWSLVLWLEQSSTKVGITVRHLRQKSCQRKWYLISRKLDSLLGFFTMIGKFKSPRPTSWLQAKFVSLGGQINVIWLLLKWGCAWTAEPNFSKPNISRTNFLNL